jgi:phosphoribosyl 1,2-cyclic phosphate phosphodiesterase
MKIQYLGTAAAEGMPAFFCDCPVCTRAAMLGGKNIRTRSQCLIDDVLLIDYPPDTYLHTITGGLELKKVNHVLITHTHGDHFFPHDVNMNSPPCNIGTIHPVIFYGNDKVQDALNPLAEQSSGGLQVKRLNPFVPATFGGYRVTPLRALHDRSETCLIFSVELGRKRFLYGNDTGYFPEDTMECIRGQRFDAISLDCTTGKDRDGDNHMGFLDIQEMRRRLIGNGCADDNTQWIANHFSHNYGYVYEDAAKLLQPAGFTVSYDGMVVEI